MTTATRSALHTRLCERLGIRYPICQAGMAFVARAELAAAVSAAGGLGVIAAAHGTATDLREEIHRVRDLTDKPFGVDILFAGVRATGDVRSAADVMTSIVEEAEAILHRLGSRA
jgi:enoyl-[acyl-carrier protein] reductase II